MNYTIQTGPNQEERIRSTTDWNESFQSDKNYIIIRCREDSNGELLGQIVIDLQFKCSWLLYLAVKPEKRNQGIETELMSKAERTITSRGYKNILLNAEQEALIPYYENLGYSKVKQDEETNEWIMQKIFE